MGEIDEVTQFLVKTFGYLTVIRSKDFILLFAGIFIGGMVVSLLNGRLFYKINKVENLGKMIALKLEQEKETYYFANPSNFAESVQVLMTLSIMPFFGKRDYTLANEKRTKIFLWIVEVLGILLVLIAIILALNPIMADGNVK